MTKVLIITYYYPPSGGSGVQRWMYFTKYMKEFGFHPYVVTVEPQNASYKFLDENFLKHVENVEVYKTKTLEPLKAYSKLVGGDARADIPQGFAGESNPGFFRKLSRFIRGNLFIPDARIGWNRFAFKKASELILKEGIQFVITNGTPHSTHLVGLKLKKKFGIKWIADFRDPWGEAYYNKHLYRTSIAEKIDHRLEQKVLDQADMVTTIGPGMMKLLKAKLSPANQNKVKYVYNGYDDEIFRGLIKNKEKKFTILHLGILSENQPIKPFLVALKRVAEAIPDFRLKSKISYVGKVSPSILQETKELLPEIELEIIEYVPHASAIQHILNANLLLNSLAQTDESKLLISGKLMEYIASGNPVLVLGNPQGDAAELLSGMEVAKVFDRGNTDGIIDFVNRVYNDWKSGKQYEKTEISKFSRHETTREYVNLLKELS